jgi:sulfonate transport system ATP-binding protein
MSDTQLTLKHIHKQFEQKQQVLSVLEDINLEIKRGEFVSIVGSSGCGKSTLLRLIAGLDQDFQGQLLLNGQAIHGPSLKRGIVFQEHRLLPWLNVRENIRLALNSSGLSKAEQNKLIDEHIHLVGLTGFETAYPHQLSGGMSQRVAIARGLVNRPDILLLDEPFSALDAITRHHLQQELQRIWQLEGITMILVTHDIEEAIFLGDRVVIMAPRPGRIQRILDVPLQHPRDYTSAELNNLKVAALTEFARQDNLGIQAA